MILYRIQWKSLITGYLSHGDWFSTDEKPMLENNIKKMNKEYEDVIIHWLDRGV